MQSTVVILGTGGTIAAAGGDVGYAAGQLSVAQLLAAVPALSAWPLEAEQVAQLDSKDMSHEVWQRLAQRVVHHLARPEVAGVVVTHGTDTLEETAYFLQRVLAPAKPVVLTAAMRPATSLQADGPQNLLDAVAVAAHPGARGVVAVLQGRVHGPVDVRKREPFALDAFDSGEAGPVALVQDQGLRVLRPWPATPSVGTQALERAVADWPRVGVVASHAGVDGVAVRAMVAAGYQGLVLEGTGNGTVHAALVDAAAEARAAGRVVWRSTRCAGGGVVGQPAGELPSAGVLTPARARIELMLRLMAGEQGEPIAPSAG
ncbi:asparaginase [Ideonella sp.]|uniref:asparaginase n=1 Tax=Ideonella sp. TaxID=1929293 RepID=UPI0035B00E4D